MTELLVRELTQNDCEQIAKLFCTDNLLRNELNFQDRQQLFFHPQSRIRCVFFFFC